ncbi:RNA polymerase sigma factor [Planctomycetota bacterium]
MVWLAYAVLLNQDLVEDVAQQAFVIACEKRDDLRNPQCFWGWLARIFREDVPVVEMFSTLEAIILHVLNREIIFDEVEVGFDQGKPVKVWMATEVE